jgi:hypothetical protein
MAQLEVEINIHVKAKSQVPLNLAEAAAMHTRQTALSHLEVHKTTSSKNLL